MDGPTHVKQCIAVSHSKRKMLSRLNQHGTWSGPGAPSSPGADEAPPAESCDPPHLGTAAQRGKPVALPRGTADRKASLRGGGYRTREKAKAGR